MEYDEEKAEEQDQFHRRGDYSRDNPDIAVENVKPWQPMSTEDQLLGMTRACMKLQTQNKALLEALEAVTATLRRGQLQGIKGDFCSFLLDSPIGKLVNAAIEAAKE